MFILSFCAVLTLTHYGLNRLERFKSLLITDAPNLGGSGSCYTDYTKLYHRHTACDIPAAVALKGNIRALGRSFIKLDVDIIEHLQLTQK